MKIGIIIHSYTGHTYSVAEKLQEKFLAAGNEVSIEQVKLVDDEEMDVKKIQIETFPDLNAYDVLIFGASVRAFSLSPAMTAYMTQIPSIQDKKIACFVTKGLPFHRTGGNQAISQMKKICESRGGTVMGTGIVIWRGNIEKEIDELIEKFSALF